MIAVESENAGGILFHVFEYTNYQKEMPSFSTMSRVWKNNACLLIICKIKIDYLCLILYAITQQWTNFIPNSSVYCEFFEDKKGSQVIQTIKTLICRISMATQMEYLSLVLGTHVGLTKLLITAGKST